MGGLRQNQDWDGDKGTLLVGSATDNLGIKFPVGGNDQVLTVNLTKDSGLEWRAIPRDNLKTNPAWDAKGNLLAGTGADTADILGVGANNAILTADSNSSTGLAWKTTFTGDVTGNAGTVTNGVYTAGDQTIGGTKTFSNTISGSIDGNAATVTNGVYTTNFTGSNQNTGTNGYQKFPGGFTIQWGTTGDMPDPTGGNDVAEQYQTFATPFTSAVFSVVATPAVNNPPPGDKKDHWACVDVSVNGFNMLSMMENRSNTYRWIAIGV